MKRFIHHAKRVKYEAAFRAAVKEIDPENPLARAEDWQFLLWHGRRGYRLSWGGYRILTETLQLENLEFDLNAKLLPHSRTLMLLERYLDCPYYVKKPHYHGKKENHHDGNITLFSARHMFAIGMINSVEQYLMSEEKRYEDRNFVDA